MKVPAGHFSDPLLRALREAHEGNFMLLGKQFVRRWEKVVAGTVTDPVPLPESRSTLVFRQALDGLFLRGFEEPTFLLPYARPNNDADLLPMLRPGYRNSLRTDVPPLVLCPSCGVHEMLREQLPVHRAVLLTPVDLESIFAGTSTMARQTIRQAVMRHLSIPRLQPYDTTRPVSGEIFFGRAHELRILREQERDSLLITGPTRIGKSSLVHHYRWQLRRDGEPRQHRSFYLNLQACANWEPDDIARYVATSFREVPYTQEDLKFRDLRSFLHSVLAHAGGPIEVIADEADAVCHTDLLLTLAEFAAASRSRLIVAGLGRVRRFWRQHFTSSFGRLRDIRCQALLADEAWDLFSQPLRALGFELEQPERMRQVLLNQTSRMPHLIQGLARSVIEYASEKGYSTLMPGLLSRMHDSFFDFGLLRNHLRDLSSDIARLAGLEVLRGAKYGLYTAERIRDALQRHGIACDTAQATDICDELVINCLLTWDHSGYSRTRWDILETASRHSKLIEDLHTDCLSRLV